MTVHLISVGLAVRRELGAFDEEGWLAAGQPPKYATLEGYAYEREAGGYRLTAFGVGLVGLYGLSPAVLRG